ncbi:MAG: HD domain-containing protein [Deltaproteobacteria bacterium]|nr:MAG: HD domain-containing protein [Deltaproteobacteria bacterium]
MNAVTSDREALLAAIREDPRLGPLFARVDAAMDDDPGHDLAHVLRVALWTLRIGGDTVDPDEAVAAALLHDIVNVPKNSPDRARASELCADQARAWLPEHGFAPDAVGRIADAIRDHSFSRGAVPQEALGMALQDADRLEALGVIGLFRCISTGSRMGARYFHDDDPWATRGRARDDRAYSIDHFFEKLLGLHATMNTAAGRAEALRRTAYLEATLAQLGAEIGEAPPA